MKTSMCTPMPAWIRWGLEVNLPHGHTKGRGKSAPTQEQQEIGNYFSWDHQWTFDELDTSSCSCQRHLKDNWWECHAKFHTDNERSEIGKNGWAARENKAIRAGAIEKVKHSVGMFRKSGSWPKINGNPVRTRWLRREWQCSHNNRD